jgi:hypothetical protein
MPAAADRGNAQRWEFQFSPSTSRVYWVPGWISSFRHSFQRAEPQMRATRHRDHLDRRIVTTKIGAS